MSKVIKVNGVFVNADLSPQLLEMNDHLTRYRRGQRKRNNTFVTNPLKFINFLCKHFNVKWFFKKSLVKYPDKSIMVTVEYDIPAMDIKVTGVGSSVRAAKRNAMFNLHYQYCKKCVDINLQ